MIDFGRKFVFLDRNRKEIRGTHLGDLWPVNLVNRAGINSSLFQNLTISFYLAIFHSERGIVALRANVFLSHDEAPNDPLNAMNDFHPSRMIDAPIFC
jgi:hypothetical protein